MYHILVVQELPARCCRRCKFVLPTISRPTTGIGPVGFTTSIPSLLLTVDSCTSVISPNGIVAHLLFLVKNLSEAVEVPSTAERSAVN